MGLVASLKVQQEVRAVVTLAVILIIGAVLRLHDVDYRTLNHPEVYSPGIDLPWDLSNPNPRFSLAQTLKGTIAGEPHPPGYYILMLGWTKLFGSSILALRLPSVLFGVASILLVYVLARHIEDTLTALLAAAMLALNGLHLYLSQTARMYSMACFLGLLSTVILAILVKEGAPRSPIVCSTLLSPWRGWPRTSTFGRFSSRRLCGSSPPISARRARYSACSDYRYSPLSSLPRLSRLRFIKVALPRVQIRLLLWKECSAFFNLDLFLRSICLPYRSRV